MVKNKNIQPTESELEILRILWETGPATVRMVHERLARSKKAGYTTTLKLMQIMYDKRLVKRDATQRSHVYEALVSQVETSRSAVNKLLHNFFQGSSSRLVIQALGDHKASKEELEAIRAYLNTIEQRNKK